MAGARTTRVFFRHSLSSQNSGFSGTCTSASVASKDHGIRASGEPSERSLAVCHSNFSEQYARKSGTFFRVVKGGTAVVIKGLGEHKETLGAPLCPCGFETEDCLVVHLFFSDYQHYNDMVAEVQKGFWDCPCVLMREECRCMLFLTEDNDFAGDEQEITVDKIAELI